MNWTRILVAVLVTGALGVILVGVGSGSPRPSDVALLRQACRTPPPGSAYDYDYATVNSSGVVTGVALCGSDGSVSSWNPRPTGFGDEVRVYERGQAGP